MKVEALNKIMYLRLFDCDTHWLPFHVVEIMSLAKYSFKRSGYKAAASCLVESEEALMMATNQLKKDMKSPMQEVRQLVLELLVALPEGTFLQEFAADVVRIIQSGNEATHWQLAPLLWKICRMDEDYWDVVSESVIATLQNKEHLTNGFIGLLPELSTLYPQRMLRLVPHMYSLFVDSSVPPWAKIKLLKAFQTLSAHEPRLSKKIGPTLRTLLHESTPMPLLYESITTVFCTLPHDETLVALCCQNIPLFFSRGDANLTYLGLHIILHLIRAQGTERAQEFEQQIVECLKTEDSALRKRGLLLIGMLTNASSLKHQTEVLMGYLRQACLSPGTEDAMFCADLVSTILSYCIRENYSNVEDDVWYVNVLAKLARFPLGHQAQKWANSVLDFCADRPGVHAHAVRSFRPMLDSLALLEGTTEGSQVVLSVVSWVVGEYCIHLDGYPSVILSMLKPLTMPLSEEVRLGFTCSILKVLLSWQRKGLSLQDKEQIHAIRDQMPSISQVQGLVELEQRLQEIKNVVGRMCEEPSVEQQDKESMLRSIAAMIAEPLSQPNATIQKERASKITARFIRPLQEKALLDGKYETDPNLKCLKDLKPARSASRMSASELHRTLDGPPPDTDNKNDEVGRGVEDNQHHVHMRKHSIYYLGVDACTDESLGSEIAPESTAGRVDFASKQHVAGSTEHAGPEKSRENDPRTAEEQEPSAQGRSSRRKPSREAFIKDA